MMFMAFRLQAWLSPGPRRDIGLSTLACLASLNDNR
jgi:hypothetical protein